MRTAIVTITQAGSNIARLITSQTGGVNIGRNEVKSEWKNFDAFIFIGSMGICVRTISGLPEDKHTDPAVVCIDSTGRYVVSVLSGHIGGANSLTEELASMIGGIPIITTQSDNQGLWALDTLAAKFGWTALTSNMNSFIFQFINLEPTALLTDIHDEGTEYLLSTLPDHVEPVGNINDITPNRHKLAIIVSHKKYPKVEGVKLIQYVPKVVYAGIGLAQQASPVEGIISSIWSHIDKAGIYRESVKAFATIDIKKDEPVITSLKKEGFEIKLFTSDELAKTKVPNPSSVVMSHVGTPSVSEASALLASSEGELILEKKKGSNYTIALAIEHQQRTGGHIEIVGAGPGDPDLISVRGRKFLEEADLVLYAGSLVPRELTDCCKPGATILSSAPMTLEEQCTTMERFYRQGKQVVRLHTGDPCIFGAIEEQMSYFDSHGMDYHITPGISSFLAAAAELKSQFTIPEKCQTIILTRGEGRTPTPEREKLHLLARSRSTMCIFLSASIAEEVQKELLAEYPADTPVAACYHLTWKDQRIYRGKLCELSKMIKDNHLTLTTMIVVGEAIDNRKGESLLYSRHFTHLFRKGEE